MKVAEQTEPSDATRGFLDVVAQLLEILEKGLSACSCVRCMRIGDAAIALDAPREMRLESSAAKLQGSKELQCPDSHRNQRHPPLLVGYIPCARRPAPLSGCRDLKEKPAEYHSRASVEALRILKAIKETLPQGLTRG